VVYKEGSKPWSGVMGLFRKESDHEFYFAVVALVVIQALSCCLRCPEGPTVTQNTTGPTGDIGAGQDSSSGCTGINTAS